MKPPAIIPCLGCIAETPPMENPAKILIHGFVSAMGIAAFEPRCLPLYLASICDRHLPMVAMAIASFAQKNEMSANQVTSKLEGFWK